MWSVYILQCRDQTLYTGITNNLSKRLKMHESGQAAKYTKGRGPFELVYIESLENRSMSTKRESKIKKLTKENKKKLIERYRNGLRNTLDFSSAQTDLIFVKHYGLTRCN